MHQDAQQHTAALSDLCLPVPLALIGRALWFLVALLALALFLLGVTPRLTLLREGYGGLLGANILLRGDAVLLEPRPGGQSAQLGVLAGDTLVAIDGVALQRLLIADDQLIARSGLRHLLDAAPAIAIIGEAVNGAQTVEMAESLQPDVILMDLRMPVLNGIEATRRIHQASPHIGILVLTMFDDDTSVFPAIRAGARGYLLKDTDQAELLRAVQTVAAGGVIFSAGIAQRVIQYMTPPLTPAPTQTFAELTPRERAILELLAQGQSNGQIADQLSPSPKTVSNNVSNVLLKLQATDRARLMLMAINAGFGRVD